MPWCTSTKRQPRRGKAPRWKEGRKTKLPTAGQWGWSRKEEEVWRQSCGPWEGLWLHPETRGSRCKIMSSFVVWMDIFFQVSPRPLVTIWGRDWKEPVWTWETRYSILMSDIEGTHYRDFWGLKKNPSPSSHLCPTMKLQRAADHSRRSQPGTSRGQYLSGSGSLQRR